MHRHLKTNKNKPCFGRDIVFLTTGGSRRVIIFLPSFLSRVFKYKLKPRRICAFHCQTCRFCDMLIFLVRMLPSVILPLLAGKVLLIGPTSEAENRPCLPRSMPGAVPHCNAGEGCWASFYDPSASGPNYSKSLCMFIAHESNSITAWFNKSLM